MEQINYLFEVVNKDSEYYGEKFFVAVLKTEGALKEARRIAQLWFPDEALLTYGPFTAEEAEGMGFDTY